MGSELEIAQLLTLAAGLLAAGLVTGLLAGLFGVGGGAILVPVLYEVFRILGVDEAVRMHMVLGTSFAIIVPTSLRSAYGHWQKGAMDRGVVRRLAPWIALGTVLGVVLAKIAAADQLKWVWVVAGYVMALKMALGRDDWRLGERLPKSRALEVSAGAIGLVSALMSIGGGMFVVSLLTLYAMPIHAAVATSSGFGPVISIPGTIGYIWAGLGVPGRPPLSLGYVNALGVALIVPTSLLAVPWGVSLAHSFPKRRLELAFATFVALVATRFLFSLVG